MRVKGDGNDFRTLTLSSHSCFVFLFEPSLLFLLLRWKKKKKLLEITLNGEKNYFALLEYIQNLVVFILQSKETYGMLEDGQMQQRLSKSVIKRSF